MPMSSSSEPEVPDLPETPDVTGAYPRLTDEQTMLLSRYGERRRLAKAATLFCEGDRDCGMFVVLDGRVAVLQEDSPEAESRVIAVHARGRFVGDLSMLTGQAVYVTAVAQTDVQVLEVVYDRLKEAVTQDQALGDLILRAFILRRNIHTGRRGSPDHRLALLSRHPPAEGLREPQSHPVPLGGRGGGSRCRGHPAGVRHRARPDPRRDLEGTDGPAKPQHHGAG